MTNHCAAISSSNLTCSGTEKPARDLVYPSLSGFCVAEQVAFEEEIAAQIYIVEVIRTHWCLVFIDRQSK